MQLFKLCDPASTETTPQVNRQARKTRSFEVRTSYTARSQMEEPNPPIRAAREIRIDCKRKRF